MFAVIHLIGLLDPTPDTSGYMTAGYVVIFSVMLIYLVSLLVRRRNLEKDYETLEELEKAEGDQEVSPAARQAETIGK